MTYGLPITCLFFVVGRNYEYQFNCNCLRNKKLFLNFFSLFLKSTSNFKSCKKKDGPSCLMYFRNYRLQKLWLDKCLKSPVSEQHSTVNILNGPNTAEICKAALFSDCSITPRQMELENISLHEI